MLISTTFSTGWILQILWIRFNGLYDMFRVFSCVASWDFFFVDWLMSCHVYQISSYKVKLDSGSILLIRYNFGLSKFATTLWTKMADFLSFHAWLLDTFFFGRGGNPLKTLWPNFPLKWLQGLNFQNATKPILTTLFPRTPNHTNHPTRQFHRLLRP